jgi:hypothetical protein
VDEPSEGARRASLLFEDRKKREATVRIQRAARRGLLGHVVHAGEKAGGAAVEGVSKVALATAKLPKMVVKESINVVGASTAFVATQSANLASAAVHAPGNMLDWTKRGVMGVIQRTLERELHKFYVNKLKRVHGQIDPSHPSTATDGCGSRLLRPLFAWLLGLARLARLLRS